jgi:radical SAM protein with 4Fe4S-binding SPASM domain
MSTAEIELFFKQSNQFSWVDLTGGEPSLRKDFVEICSAIGTYCKNLILLHFPTNGLLTDKIVRDVLEIKKNCPPFKIIITVSTDGDEQSNDEIRGIPGGWRKQIETFQRLRDIKGVRVVFGMTLSPFNYDRFEKTYKSLQNAVPHLTPHEFHISLMNFSDSFYDNMALKKDLEKTGRMEHLRNEMLKVTQQYKQMIGFPTTPSTVLEHLYMRLAKTFLKTGRTPLPCHALKSSCFIDPSGEVYPCITYNHPLGKLRNHNYCLQNIWNLEKTKHLQADIWDLQCPQCWTGCDGYQTIMGNLKRLVMIKATSILKI